MGRTRVVISISLPPEMAKEYEKLTRETKKSKSELFREMFRVYRDYLEEREYENLLRYGERKAEQKQISEDDVERLIHEARSA
jgi:metal-responsive CopG/Arc/MetJ family transcriptional regulator